MKGSNKKNNITYKEELDSTARQMSLLPMLNHESSFSSICNIIGCENNSPAWPDQFGKAIGSWLVQKGIQPIKTLSLFSGAGGLDIGFSDVGFEIVCSVEIEKQFCETLELNSGEGKRFPNSKVNCIDIRNFSGKGLGKIDFIIGGPPCQTFSAAGRRANGVLGTTDTRGVLFKEYVRLLKTLSPRGFLFENVYGIVGAQNGEAWAEILKAFSDVGYKLFYRIVDAADYGVPQHRERLLIVGLKEGSFKFPRPTHGADSLEQQPYYNAETAIEGVNSKESDESNKLGGRYASLLPAIPPGLNYSFYTEEMGHPKPIFAWRSKFSDFLYKADPNKPVRTIKASGGAYTGPLHWENRFFNLEEYKRLQTFPEDYHISGKKQVAVKQIGNSVPPQLARIMALAIRKQVFDTEFPFEISLLEECEVLSFRKKKRELTDEYRKKAEQAIRSIKGKANVLPRSRSYLCSLDNNFRFQENPSQGASYRVNVNWGAELQIIVADKESKHVQGATTITIRPQNKKWNLGVTEVMLMIKTRLHPGFTIAWKAFERELIANAFKADLVQLGGYYQYPTKLCIRADIPASEKYATALESILTSQTIPQFKNQDELASEWCVSTTEIIKVAEYMKMLGYEIRNHITNPQIEIGKWLVPYAFPTLSPLSVQLWKKLR